MQPWYAWALAELRECLEADEYVLAFIIAGSSVQAGVELDAWSDLDVVVIVRDVALRRYFPTTDWLARLGPLYTYTQPAVGTTRAVFTNMNRVDLVIRPESDLESASDWGSALLWRGYDVVFTRSPAVSRALSGGFDRPVPSPIRPETWARMTDAYWFKGTLAVYKVVRGDLLIALHLSLDLVRDCCVVGMMLRDRSTGTSHHRQSTAAHQIVARLDASRHPYTAHGILDSIEASSIAFDELATEWSGTPSDRRHPLLAWIARARTQLGERYGRPGGSPGQRYDGRPACVSPADGQSGPPDDNLVPFVGCPLSQRVQLSVVDA